MQHTKLPNSQQENDITIYSYTSAEMLLTLTKGSTKFNISINAESNIEAIKMIPKDGLEEIRIAELISENRIRAIPAQLFDSITIVTPIHPNDFKCLASCIYKREQEIKENTDPASQANEPTRPSQELKVGFFSGCKRKRVDKKSSSEGDLLKQDSDASKRRDVARIHSQFCVLPSTSHDEMKAAGSPVKNNP